MRESTTSPPDVQAEPRAGWFPVLSSIKDRLPTLSGAAVKLLLALAARANRSTRACWPSWAVLASDTGLARASIRKGLAELSETGLVEIVLGEGTKGQGGTSSLYVVRAIRSGSENEPVGSGSKNELVQKVDRSGSKSAHEVVQKLNPNQNKEPIRITRSAARPLDMDSWFSDFWRAYPKRAAREAARKAYAKAIDRITKEDSCTRLDASQTLLEAATAYAAARASEDPKFTKHPATWLNGGCWADEVAQAPVNTEQDLPFFTRRPKHD